MLGIKSKEPLRGVPAGPLRRKRAQRGKDASAAERLRVGPERTAELDSRRNLDPGGGDSEPLELARDRTFWVLVAERRAMIEPGEHHPPPYTPRAARERPMPLSVVGGVDRRSVVSGTRGPVRGGSW